MKMIRLATIAALTTTILAGGTAAFANEVRDVETDGQVIFVPNEEEETEVAPPEPGPDVEIPPVGPEGQTGPLTIAYAPTMDFGTQVISNKDMAYNMVAELQQLEGTEGDDNKVPYVSFAQVQDTRGNNAGWDLSVTLSAFESGTQNNELRGAQIEFVSPRLQYNGNNENNAPTIHEAGLRLDASGDKQDILTAAETKGAGTSSVVWGDQASLNTQFADETVEVVENDAIKLHVPGATAKDAAVYEATLTWNLTSAVDADGETTP
jgi:hypothetical protein